MIQILGWQWAFYVQVIATVPILFILICSPSRYLDIQNIDEDEEDEIQNDLEDSIDE